MTLSALDHGARTGVVGLAGVTGIVIAAGVAMLCATAAVVLRPRGRLPFLTFLAALSAAIYLSWNVYAGTAPVSDYKVLIEAGTALAQGTFREASDRTGYFYIYNHQLGYTAYLGLVIKLLGTGLTTLKLLDMFYLVGAVLMLYTVTEKCLSSTVAAIAAMLYATFIPVCMGASIINNQHLSTLLLLVGLYLLLAGRIWHVVAAGAAFAVMNAIRPIGIVTVAAIFLYFIYQAVATRQWRVWGARLAAAGLSFLVAILIIDAVLIQTSIAPGPISKSNLPYYKFVIGLGAIDGSLFGHRTVDARKTGVYFDLQQLDFDYAAYNAAAVRYVQQRLRDYKSTLKLVARKMWYFTGERDNQYVYALNRDQRAQRAIAALVDLGQGQYTLLLLAATLAIGRRLRQPAPDLALFAILLLAFVLVHVPIETQTRYRYEAYVFIAVLAADVVGYLVAHNVLTQQ
jgi:hypothetical protein